MIHNPIQWRSLAPEESSDDPVEDFGFRQDMRFNVDWNDSVAMVKSNLHELNSFQSTEASEAGNNREAS